MISEERNYPEKSTQIINACIVLHNICVTNNVALPMEEGPTNIDMGIHYTSTKSSSTLVMEQHFKGNDLVKGRHIRAGVANYLHRNRAQSCFKIKTIYILQCIIK